jgi:hypothetical protein
MASLAGRMVRAAKLDVTLYEEVEADRTAMGQAMTVVVLSAVAAGVGGSRHAGVGGLLALVVVSLLGWYVWAFLTYWIGTRILPEPSTRADHGELLRTLGFASAPGVLRILGVIPGLGGLAALGAAIWMLVATVVAVKQALDYTSTGRAVGVCLIGWIVQAILTAVVMALVGVPLMIGRSM